MRSQKYILAMISATLILAECDTSSEVANISTPTDPTLDNAANELARVGSGLEGSWAEAFKRAADNTNNSKIKAILEDGYITASERNEIQEDFRKYAKPLGIIDAYFHPNCGYNLAHSPDLLSDNFEDKEAQYELADSYQKLCEDESDVTLVEELYYLAGSNPENIDTSEGILECFKREGIVDDSYTLEEFKLDFQTGSYPLIPIEAPYIHTHEGGAYVVYDELFYESMCEQDPFGNLGLRNLDWSVPIP